jgi:hypothetical protein
MKGLKALCRVATVLALSSAASAVVMCILPSPLH